MDLDDKQFLESVLSGVQNARAGIPVENRPPRRILNEIEGKLRGRLKPDQNSQPKGEDQQ